MTDCCSDDAGGADRSPRQVHLAHALWLEYLTVGWNIVEGVIGVGAALASGSVALLGFGIDSFVETASGGVLIWRLLAESRTSSVEAIERLDRSAHNLVALSLFALAAYVVTDASRALWLHTIPEGTTVGIALTSISIGVMMWLARAKRRASVALGSRALAADSFQTTACWWISIVTLAGLGLNRWIGWWWADPIAAVGVSLLLMKEGRQAWRGDDCCA